MRILRPLNFNRQISTSFITKPHSLTITTTLKSHYYHPRANSLNLSPSPLLQSRTIFLPSLSLSSNAQNAAVLHFPSFPDSSRLGFLLHLSSTSFSPNSPIHRADNVNSFKIEADNGGYFHWHRASDSIGTGFSDGGKREVAAAVLGWLGAKPKHLKRYAEMYTSRGIDAITFVVPVRDVLRSDLGRKVENRIRELANELVSWLSKGEGRERCLIFHTFSNTGWLVYGAILGHLQERPDLIERIRGCIVDSGGDPELNPKVWAAGFTAAVLKRRNTGIYPLIEGTESNRDRNMTKLQDEDPPIFEACFLLVLEKIFSFLLKLPDVNQRISKIISLLSENQPLCPQLYLYSTADKVISYRAVESFMEHQKMKGRTVWSFNFGTSPHVDHYRTFPNVYSSQVNNFLNEI